MVFNDTFNNISVISWQSVLLVEETGVPGENHQLVALYRIHIALAGFQLTSLVVIGTDCISSNKSNYHHDHDCPLLQLKSSLMKGVAFLEGDNLP